MIGNLFILQEEGTVYGDCYKDKARMTNENKSEGISFVFVSFEYHLVMVLSNPGKLILRYLYILQIYYRRSKGDRSQA